MTITDVFYLIGIVLLFIVFFYVVYLTTYFVSKLNKKMQSGKNIKVIERVTITRNKFLMIVSLGDQYYFLSETDENIELIDTLKNIDIAENDTENYTFNKIFSDKIISKIKKDKQL
jgi:flagellar biosynthetic protein FliO